MLKHEGTQMIDSEFVKKATVLIPQRKKTIRQHINTWLNQDGQKEKLMNRNTGQSVYAQPKAEGSAQLEAKHIRFNLYRAAGGFVVETSNYNPTKDHSDRKLYIINNENDLGHELAKIVTLEGLSR